MRDQPALGVAGDASRPRLAAAGISKSFNRIPALRDVDLTVRAGEVHGVVGQNGAGKSTLMKILSGIYVKDAGTISIDGRVASYGTPLGARAHGLGMVFQEFSLVPTLSVAQNVFLTRERQTPAGLLDDAAGERQTARILDELGVAIRPQTPVQDLSVGARQLVEIAKALSQEPRILILDEPTASLSASEIATLFAVIRRLKSRDMSIIYISHHLEDLMRIADRVTVLRDGRRVLTHEIADVKLGEVIAAMLGGELASQPAATARQPDRGGLPLLEARNLSTMDRVRDVSFAVWPGEVLGVAGLLGSGRSELLRAIFGIDPLDGGEILIRGQRMVFRDTADAIAGGMALVPEDRRSQGLVLEHTVKENLLLPIWRRLDRFGVIDDREANVVAARYVRDLNIRTSGLSQVVKFLSGGNQQKVVVGKSLSIAPSILLLDEPTFGIDIRSKQEILAKVRGFADAGNAVVLVDSELAQLALACDRVLILRQGRIWGGFDRKGGRAIAESALHHAIHGDVEDGEMHL